MRFSAFGGGSPAWMHDGAGLETRAMATKKKTFSVVKAVKANARERVGTVPPERVIPDPKAKRAKKPKHKETLADLLNKDENG